MPPIVPSPNHQAMVCHHQKQLTKELSQRAATAGAPIGGRGGVIITQRPNIACLLPSQPLEPHSDPIIISKPSLSTSPPPPPQLLPRIGRSVNTGRGPEAPRWVMVSTPRGLLLTSLLVLPTTLRTLCLIILAISHPTTRIPNSSSSQSHEGRKGLLHTSLLLLPTYNSSSPLPRV